jgi:hypothetical protein
VDGSRERRVPQTSHKGVARFHVMAAENMDHGGVDRHDAARGPVPVILFF